MPTQYKHITICEALKKEMSPKISVIIPAYNEEKTIKTVVQKVMRQNEVGEIIVVDDGSKDATAELLLPFTEKQDQKVKFFKHTINLGKGAAIRNGLNHVTYPYLLIQDADLEYDPQENYKNIISQAAPKKVVYGTRLSSIKNKHAYLRTYLGNVFITAFCNSLYGARLTDIYTGYKLIPTEVARALELKSSGFEIEAEITAKLLKRKIKITEIPVHYTPRNYKQGKKIVFKDAIKGALTLLKIKFSDFNLFFNLD